MSNDALRYYLVIISISTWAYFLFVVILLFMQTFIFATLQVIQDIHHIKRLIICGIILVFDVIIHSIIDL